MGGTGWERGVEDRDTKKRERDPGRGRQGPRARRTAPQRGSGGQRHKEKRQRPGGGRGPERERDKSLRISYRDQEKETGGGGTETQLGERRLNLREKEVKTQKEGNRFREQ